MKTLLTSMLVLLFISAKSQSTFIMKDRAYVMEKPNAYSKTLYITKIGDTVIVGEFDGDYVKIKKGDISGYVSKLFMVVESKQIPYVYPTYIKVGITTGDLIHLIGNPTVINKNEGTYGVHEQWVYRKGTKTEYYYFEDYKLTSWSTSN